MADAAYHRAWRAAHPEYRARQNRLRQERRRAQGRGDRTAEYTRRNAHRASRAEPELPLLMPELQRGRRVSFYDDELRLDVAQERALARLEGRDEEEAARAYTRRELGWVSWTLPLLVLR